jgi:hypothetical protein
MVEHMWRFPNNGYTNENGLDTSDMEMFKKDPVSSLAREICQNSLDAAFGEKPVRVEFSLFKIIREEVPGIDKLTEQIIACYEYKKDSAKEGAALAELKKSIESQTITCLRISDFNTTGIFGATTNERGTPFYTLTKGSGVSDKDGCSGGSKGIGKYASFVVSTTNTVFYSTRAKDGSCGYIGISKLRSTPIPRQDPDLLTMGIGYYGANDKNFPILEEIHLDKSFSRGEKEYGTDVYIIGFNNFKGWQSDIIAKVLESFMVAIMRGELEVVVDGIIVNKDTVKEIIYSSEFQAERTKTEYKEIRAQYELLQGGESVTIQELQIDEHNFVTVYLKQYSQQDEANATKRCVMVRYPYMKITHITSGAYLPFSALCIIHDNELNRKLRAIENPQHTDWEIKRLIDFPEKKMVTRQKKKALEQAVKEFIKNVLRESSGESTDIEGAGEFLPSQDELGGVIGSAINNEQMLIKPISPVKLQMPKTDKVGEYGESYEFSEGELVEEGEDCKKLLNKKKKKLQPNPAPKSEPKDGEEVGPGKSPVLKKVPLSGMRYRTVVTDKIGGKYDCIFTSQYDESDCEFAIRLCGEAADKYPMEIISASIEGTACEIQDGKIVRMRIEKGKTYKISYCVKSSEMFACEVILYAYR